MKWRFAPVGKNPLSPRPWMIPDRSSPSRVRFAPWTAAGRSEEMAVYEGKGGSGRVDGPKGNLSVIPDALSRSRGALSPAGP